MSTGLCVCVCAADLFGEDLLQRGYRPDRAVLVHGAAHPGAATRHRDRAIGVPEGVVVRNLGGRDWQIGTSLLRSASAT